MQGYRESKDIRSLRKDIRRRMLTKIKGNAKAYNRKKDKGREHKLDIDN